MGRFDEDVRALAAALSAYGLSAGQCAAVLGAEGYDTLRAGLAVLASGATLVPLDPAISDDTLRNVLESTGTVHAIASDERQLARILALRPDLPALDLVLLMAAAPSERKPAAMLVDAALEVGAARLADDPTGLARAFAESDGKAACRILDAAGGIRPVNRNLLLAVAGNIADTLGVSRGKTVLMALPVSSLERLGTALAVVSRGGTLLVADPSERPDAGLGERAADAMLLTVAGLERLHRAWTEDIEGTSWLARRMTRWALRQGVDSKARTWKHRVADTLALRGLRERLGGKVTELHVVPSPRGGAASEVDAFFKSTGLPIRYFNPEKGAVLAR